MNHQWKRPTFALLILLAVPACAYLRTLPISALPVELDELSGLTRSLATDDWLWAHNDSGDTPRLFRLGLDGSDGGIAEVPNVLAIDWEDIAAFRWQGQAALLIGDIGDNNAKRSAVTLYAVTDPGANGTVATLLWSLHFRYADGARDAEGLAVDPVTGEILILSKRQRPPVVYRLPMPQAAPAAGAMHTASRLGPVLQLPKPTADDLADDPVYGALRDWPTALDISPDGRFAVVTTYKDAYRYQRHDGEDWAAAFTRLPQTIPLPQWRQTEAGAITTDGARFCAGSEQRHGFACVMLPPLLP